MIIIYSQPIFPFKIERLHAEDDSILQLWPRVKRNGAIHLGHHKSQLAINLSITIAIKMRSSLSNRACSAKMGPRASPISTKVNLHWKWARTKI